MNDYIGIIIWVVVIGVAFVLFWRFGYLRRLSNHVQETKEELRKCTWPSVQELKGSTVVVLISTIILAGFTAIVDLCYTFLVRFIT